MADRLTPIAPHVVHQAVLAALDEDGAGDDLTTRALVSPEQWGHGTFVAKDIGVVAGLPIAAAAMTALDETVSFDTLVPEGERVAPGTELAEVEGPLSAMLASERVALNFLQRISGIATLTREYVDAIAGTGVRVLDTRKTAPGLRPFDRYAVRAGGGYNHRFNLSTGILIKDNHIEGARQAGVPDLVAVLARSRAAGPHTMRIEIEVASVDQLKEAIEGGADIILLDNMSAEQIRECVGIVAGRAQIEASGGVTLENVRAIAEAGVDFISVGRLTHSAPALDISLELGDL
ncbi:MAG: carboxylating nicotinate-nucleotide diphosphorylase [Chloroflexota bacterium]|nr:carboxylating nicotinate-nucleotide diphosphorylase [Chloroflexota bacterium]